MKEFYLEKIGTLENFLLQTSHMRTAHVVGANGMCGSHARSFQENINLGTLLLDI